MLFPTLITIALVIAVIALCYVFLKKFIPAEYASVLAAFVAFCGSLYIIFLIAGLITGHSYVALPVKL